MNGEPCSDINLSIDLPADKPTIPDKIERAGFRFIRIRPRSKIPNDRDWQHTRNYSAKDPRLHAWTDVYQSFEIRSGSDEHGDLYTHYEGYGNYGVLCSSDAVVLDLDTPELVAFLLETIQTDSGLPATLLCKSGSGRGIHAYYRTKKGHPVRLLDPANPDKNVGDIKSTGGQVVGPSSIHPSGRPYEIVDDREVAFVEFAVLEKVFEKYIQKAREITPESIRREYGEYEKLSTDIPIAQVLYPDKAVNLGNGEFRGAHPIHGSSGGRNFAINTHKNTWFCDRHKTGGGPLEAIALLEGIIECSESGSGCLRGEKFLQTVDAARRMGFEVKLPQKKYPKKPEFMNIPPRSAGGAASIEWDVQQLDEIPSDLPGTSVTILNAPPRLGKSHWAILKAIEAKTANVVTNTHSIIEQHLRIFRENRTKDQTAVHIEGKQRSCINKEEPCNCKKCPYYPYETKESFFQFGQVVLDHLLEVKVLTNKEVPEDQCPYWFVKKADEFSDYCFTVVANLDMLRNRHLLVIDEDPTISHFYPASVDLAESVYKANRLTINNFIEEKWTGIEKWKRYIVEKKKRPKGKHTILRIIAILEEIRDILKIDDERQFSRKYVLDKLKELDISVSDPEDCTKQEVIDLIKRYEMPDTLSPFALALLYPYVEKPFAWQGHNPSTLRIVANEETRMYTIPECKTLIIGSTRAELFAKSLGRSCTILNIDKFHYAQQFVIVSITDEGGRSYSQNLDRFLKSISQTNERERFPSLILVGTEREQQRLQTILGGIAKSSTDENRVGQTWNYRGGYLNVFYQNSVISRGIDVEFYHRLFVYSSNFANPYWQAALDVAALNDDQDEIERVGWVIDAITVDETTNSVLRISPVRRNIDTDPRMIVIGEADMWKLKPAITEGAIIVRMSAHEFTQNSKKIMLGTGRLVYMGLQPQELQEDELTKERSLNSTSTLQQRILVPDFVEFKDIPGKCKFFADTLREAAETPDWRKGIHPKVIERIEKEVENRLLYRERDRKKTTRKALQKFLLTKNKKFNYVLTDHVITDLYKDGRVRISGIGFGAYVALPPASQVAQENDWWDLEESQ